MRFGRLLCRAGLQGIVVENGAEERIGVRIAHRLEGHLGGAVRPERRRTLAADRHHLAGHQADVVLRIGVRHAEGDAGVVVGADVGNAVGRAADFGAEALLAPVTVASGATAQGRSRQRSRAKHDRAARNAWGHLSLSCLLCCRRGCGGQSRAPRAIGNGQANRGVTDRAYPARWRADTATVTTTMSGLTTRAGERQSKLGNTEGLRDHQRARQHE